MNQLLIRNLIQIIRMIEEEDHNHWVFINFNKVISIALITEFPYKFTDLGVPLILNNSIPNINTSISFSLNTKLEFRRITFSVFRTHQI